MKLETCRLEHSCRTEGPVVDLADHLLLPRVVVHDVATTGDRRAFRVLIADAVLGVRAQPVAEDAVPNRLGAVGAEDVEVRAGIAEPQTAVLVERRFADGVDVAELFEGGDVAGFVARVGDREVDVDDVLRGEVFDGGRTDVLDVDRAVAESGADVGGEGLEAVWRVISSNVGILAKVAMGDGAVDRLLRLQDREPLPARPDDRSPRRHDRAHRLLHCVH